MQSVTLRDNGACLRDVQSSTMDLSWDRLKAAQPRGRSTGPMAPIGLVQAPLLVALSLVMPQNTQHSSERLSHVG